VSFEYEPGSVVQALQQAEVDFVVIGGVALNLHGSALITSDTDVMYARDAENVGRLASALAQLDVRLRGAPADLPFHPDAKTLRAGMNFTFTSRFGDLDVLGEVAGITSYEGLRTRARLMRLGGRDVPVANVHDLIAMKRAAGRTKDLRGLDDLAAILELENRGE
jgi:predicted nucleotidyltransferase